MKALGTTASSLPVSGIRRFFDIAAGMDDVISLGVGEPDFATPWHIREVGIYGLERGRTAYTSNLGMSELRSEISRKLASLYHVRFDPAAEILVTVGVSQGLDLAARVLLDPEDEVLVPEPCYVSYRPCIELAGGRAVGVPTFQERGFRVSAACLSARVTPRTKAILMGYPSNPTGATMPPEELQAIVDFAVENDLWILSDEIYDRLTYEGRHTCLASLEAAKERTIVFNGFSKTYAMTGWRVGYACGPAHVIAAMMKVHSYTMLCAPAVSQQAAIEALRNGEPSVLDMISQYAQRRRLIVDGLNALGLTCHMPQGAFYAFPSIKSTGMDSEQFAERLLLEAKVAVAPGTAFGAGGEGHIRCSYATSVSRIEEALERISHFLVSRRS